jgi:hypothetical protein
LESLCKLIAYTRSVQRVNPQPGVLVNSSAASVME